MPIVCGPQGALVRSLGLRFLLCKPDFSILQFFDSFGQSPARPDLTSFPASPSSGQPHGLRWSPGPCSACG